MKISPFFDSFFLKVTGKKDKNSSDQDQPKHQNPQKKENRTEDEKTPSFDEVNSAIESFAADKQAQANGITASTHGTGPGLKVILKDGSGTVIRQLSGEEFLKLRSSLNKEASNNGKILDQKL